MTAVGGLCNFTGAEHFLVGLSPQFWCHRHLNISDLHRLKLIGGVNCVVLGKDEGFSPVSKCTLLGTIVNVERKGNGCVLFLLDDGSGLVDCLSFTENRFDLPSLKDRHADDSGIFRVGNVVRVMGRIQCASISDVPTTIQIGGKAWEVRDCIREINASIVEPVPESNVIDAESDHWLRCIEVSCKNYPGKRCNALDTLNLLGPEITSQVAERTHFPSADDVHGAWRVFGVSCKCSCPYMDSLLYCHCQATPEVLDPRFEFRDTLLALLLQKEAASSTEVLRFQFRTVANDERIVAKATSITANQITSVDATRLVLNTFRALRNDGILYLLDEASDTYVLLSRSRVLEPYCKERAQHSKSHPPAYLKNVPKARLQFIQRCLQQAVDEV